MFPGYIEDLKMRNMAQNLHLEKLTTFDIIALGGMNMYKIFIVEDDSTVSSLICDKLNKWGYIVYEAKDFRNLLTEYSTINPHLVLMDINLPYFDGFYWCDKIRKLSNIPIIFISSRSDESDKIRAIMGGGDDYIEKPFSIDLLIVKIQAVLRRAYSYADNSSSILTYSDIILNLEKLTVTCNKKDISLTHNECKILCLLIKATGKVVSRAKIIKALWDDESFVDDNTLTVNINRLRNKLNRIKDSNIIDTVKGKGYKLL